MATPQELSSTLRKLHVPGKPLVLTNVYDGITARAIATLAQTRALATASYAVAAAAGVSDDDLTFEINFAAVKVISSVIEEFNVPLTVDLQDGYGEHLDEALECLLGLGNVVGINLEDFDRITKRIFPVDVAAGRVKRVMDIAKKLDVSEFAVNARTDVLKYGGSVQDAIERGRAYLAAGATNIFVLGGAARGGLTKEEIAQLTNALDGRLNVMFGTDSGNLTVKELAEIGVARISIGPALQRVAAKAITEEAKRILGA